MSRCWLYPLCASAVASASLAAGPGHFLAKDGRSAYRIVVAREAAPAEQLAASELQSYLRQATGAELPLVPELRALVRAGEPSVFVGGGRLQQQAVAVTEAAELGGEEFVIRSAGPHLAIVGGRPRGTLYGVYTFLENYLGVRWLTSRVTNVPRRPTVPLPSVTRRERPAFEYREVFFFDAFDGAWAAHNKTNGHATRLTPEQGGKYPWAWYPHHTFAWLLPHDQYFAEHPEYYMQHEDGRRLPMGLCLTNRDTVRLVSERVRQWMREQPQMRVFSVSQNDGRYNCRCANCAALDAAEGSPQGSLLTFVNAVADAVRQEFPDNLVETLAYDYSMAPPKTVRPRDNVAIRFCMWLDADTNQRLLREWRKLTPNLYVWDYVTGFTHFLVPFPNLYQLQPAARLYRDVGVLGVLHQGNYQSIGGGLNEIQAYLLAKLLWDPDYDVDAGIDEFLELYYGRAAPYLREYINLLHEGLGGPGGKPLPPEDPTWAEVFKGWWLVHPPTAYLNPQRMARYVELFDRAEAAVSDNDDLLWRVRLSRMQIQTVQLATMAVDAEAREPLLDAYFATADHWNVTRYGEFKSVADFRREMGR